MIITISIFLFAMFDYWGYNLSVKRGWVNSNFINPYRIVQWGWWTPFGLVKWLVTRNQMTVISGIILAVQSFIGISITVTINLIW